MKIFSKLFNILFITLLLTACSGTEKKLEQMRWLSPPHALYWPDYADCTIPVNIAPLNFYILPEHTGFELTATGAQSALRIKGRDKVKFPAQKWHRFLAENLHQTIQVEIKLKGSPVQENLRFAWTVQDSIDAYFCCRLIEPSYQTSSLLQTIEFNLQQATTRVLFDNRLQGIGCENCHTCAQSNGDYLVYHVRFEHTGTMIITPDSILRVDLKSKRFPQGGVYPSWHPNKNIIAFGTSSAYPFIHSKDIVRRTEVYDSLGDLILYDIKNNYIFSDERLVRDTFEETFPYWSWDGKWLYLCQSHNPKRDSTEDDTEFSKKIKYSLIRVAFNEQDNTFGRIETIVDAEVTHQTVSFPRISPDGRFLAVCISDHGTFPIRHPESDLYMLDLSAEAGFSAGEGFDSVPGFAFPVKKMENVNSRFTESFHNWSSTGRWLMFSTKREDNLYSRPYFTFVDEAGRAAKPFLLPQKDPAMYLSSLRSFNVPEFSYKPIAVSAAQAKDLSLYHPVKKPDSIVILK